MKIASSIVGMDSTHESHSVSYSLFNAGLRISKDEWEASQAKLTAENNSTNENADTASGGNNSAPQDEKPAAVIDLSKNGVDASKGMTIQTPDSMKKTEEDIPPDETMSTLKALLQYLKSISKNPKAYERLEEFIENQSRLARSFNSSSNTSPMPLGVSGVIQSGSSRGNDTVMVARRETFNAESEYTTFSAAGLAKTEDGREISFNVDFAMSRDFMEYTRVDTKYVAPVIQNNVCDPLIINVGAGTTSLSDQKFTFDLDADGKSDNISLLGKGSGFLSLDINNDGKINDGNELFGTKSGDGFADLAKYDEDGNGWIDENDSVFDKLRIWFKNEDGTDSLISLKDADVGAINLGKAYTQFSLKNEDTHDLNGYIRSTGIFLKESGGSGTVQHVDFAL